ncbi:late control protein D, partial [Clostridium butyricum]|uniref:late control protein D n=3 Tax=Clostridium butyricum TaxID=1492 RepID=UPI00232BDFFA
MEAFHKLKVESPYEILEIEDIKISNNPNEHGRLYLKALLDDSINFKYAIEASTDDKISIYEETEDKEKSIIFNGTIQNIRTENINGIYYMEIEAYTSSFELDIKEKSRSFQDAEMSYDDLIKTILLDYKIYSFTQRMDKPMSIGRPLFQYKETDYEFLKRVASQIGLEINCDIINTNNVFYFGRPWGKEYEIEDNIDYEALKDIKKYRESLVHSPNFHDTDFFYYKIRTRKLMELGAQVVFKQKKFYINSYEAEYVRGELIYTYKLCRERGIWQEKLYNDKIKGISLEGEVLEVSGEKVKLHLDIDETQNKDKAAWFRYAPPTGNLMYSMPIVGTNANLYFSSERSEDPIVIGCIRKNGSSCESFSDVNNRYFATESGNNLDMLPGAIN